MSREHPGPECVDLEFAGRYSMPAGAEVALEDYARVLTRSRAASVRSTGVPERACGLHLCSPGLPLGAAQADLEAFARDLAEGVDERLGSA